MNHKLYFTNVLASIAGKKHIQRPSLLCSNSLPSQRYMAKCSYLLLLTLGLQALGILIPYIKVLQKNIFSPPLPFISQTVGFSPECGIFSFFLSPWKFFLTTTLLRLSVLRTHTNKKSQIKLKLSA
ncbi:uncharacterized protein CEXT_201311 [Caerostris extrusa]|uniref:Uncharacterized protein n=1 Tax=Caerostris extrusa TaxID=172846 RepID=A0AAV4NXD7_CAEEX|nr:uncharacterized protein CEXT_201311 [Caerostris extrusa]